ncbi:MAG: hypothetical protein LUD50_05715, partial [Clostridia bacterium]|nr:hypothetical protein [Clostridia bacterium]
MKNIKRILICIPVAICILFAAALSACVVGAVPDTGDIPNNEEGNAPGGPGKDEGTTSGGGTETPDETPGGTDETPGETPGGTDEAPDVPTGHAHSLERVEAAEATSTADGHTAYWYCEGCGRYFADAEAAEEISLADTVLHYELVHHAAVAAEELTEGNAEYWSCSVCGKYFSDADGRNETSSDSVVINPTGEHSLTAVAAVAATDTTDGNIAYWVCSNCGKYLADANGTVEIKDKTSVIIPHAGAEVTLRVETPSTVEASLKSGVTDYELTEGVLTGYKAGDSITEAGIEALLELGEDSNTSNGYLAAKTFIGWYIREVAADGSVTNTQLGTTGHALTHASATIAPYYHIYGSTTTVANNRPGSGTVSYSNNGTTETWNGVASNATTADMGSKDHSWKCIVTQMSNKAVLDSATPDGYATVGTAARTDGITFHTGDKFRFTAAVDFDPREDNVEIYRFQNYGTDTIKFKSCLTNTGTEIETANTTNAVYIFLSPGETAEYVWSSEYGSGTNTSMMIDFEAEDSFTMNMGVSMAYVTSTSADHVNSTLTGILSQLQTAGYSIGPADHNTTEGDISEANFVAC